MNLALYNKTWRKIGTAILLLVVLGGLAMTAVRAYRLRDYVTVLRYPKDSATLYLAKDSSIEITCFLYAEEPSTLAASINIEALPDSLLLQDLRVSVSSSDNPLQLIDTKGVTALVHPVSITSDKLEKLDARDFTALPASSKMITNSGLPYNRITFYFETGQLQKTRFYQFKIKGRFIRKGQAIDFSKEIRTERKLEYHPYRMMT